MEKHILQKLAVPVKNTLSPPVANHLFGTFYSAPPKRIFQNLRSLYNAFHAQNANHLTLLCLATFCLPQCSTFDVQAHN